MSAIRRRIVPDIHTGGVTIHSQQDTDEVLRFNRALYNAERSSSALWNGGDWVRVASVPLIWLEELWQQGIKYTDKNDMPKIMAMLNDRDFSQFRTAPGVL